MGLLLSTGPLATLWGMQAVLGPMRDQGWGRIVTMGSAIGLSGAPGYGPYGASKEAIRSLTRTVARRVGQVRHRRQLRVSRLGGPSPAPRRPWRAGGGL